MTSAVANITRLDELTPDPNNANRGTERGLSMLERSLRENGAGRSILVDRNGVVIAGNKTLERAVDLGFEDVIVVQSDGTKLVAVQRTDLDLTTDQMAQKLAVADNRIAEIDLAWDTDALAELQAADRATLDGLFTPDELEQLLGDAAHPDGSQDPGADMDRAAELQARWQTAAGQTWTIPSITTPGADHRLAIGDSTDPATFARMMTRGEIADMVWTDPPYGVDYTGRTAAALKIANDAMPEVALANMVRSAFTHALAACRPGAVWYITVPHGPLHRLFLDIVHDLGIWHQTLVWSKNSMVLGHSDYHYQHEPILYGWKPGEAHVWRGGRTLTTLLASPTPVDEMSLEDLRAIAAAAREGADVIEVDRPSVSRDHPTTKPPELIRRNIRASSRPGNLVLDPFAGSGSTLVACEQEARLARLIELDAAYAAVIIERASEMGLTPTLDSVGLIHG